MTAYARVKGWDKDYWFTVDSDEKVCSTLRNAARDVTELSIEGNELALIKSQFPSLPWPKTNTGKVIWYGETARFICGNVDLS